MSSFARALWERLRLGPREVREDLWPRLPADHPPAKRLRNNFLYHLLPLAVTERALLPATTLGLGLISLGLTLLCFGSGLLLLLYYVPTPEAAYASMLDIENAVSFGALVRRGHRFAAHGMVLAVGLHLVRVWGAAAYRRRELNWLLGLGLGGLTLGLAFTGYLLPWDQTAYWAVRVVTSMLDHIPGVGETLGALLRGGRQIGPPTLLRFYALHVALLPAAMGLFVALHLWRIRRDGGLARDPAAAAPTVPAWPHLVLRVGALLAVVTAVVVVVSIVVDAPLGPPADPFRPANPEKAPWYFLGLQELVSYSTVVGGFLYPLVIIATLVALPWLDREESGWGIWLGSADERRRLAVVGAMALAVGAGSAALWEPGSTATNPLADLFNPGGFLLLFALLASVAVGSSTGRVRLAARAGLTTLLLGILLATLMGIGRGPDWIFYWPWEAWPGV